MSGSDESAGDAAPPAPGVLHVGIVHGVRRVLFVAVGGSRPALFDRLAEYVRHQAELQLYREDLEHLRTLLGQGALEAAVRWYFKRVGVRWDREWLTEDTVPVGESVARPG